MKTPRKHSDAIKAWADGATIEYRAGPGNWKQVYYPSWDFFTEYRVKPADKFRVLAYKPVTDSNGWTDNKLTTLTDPAAEQWALGRTDKTTHHLPVFLFESYADADAACQAVNKSLTNF